MQLVEQVYDFGVGEDGAASAYCLHDLQVCESFLTGREMHTQMQCKSVQLLSWTSRCVHWALLSARASDCQQGLADLC